MKRYLKPAVIMIAALTIALTGCDPSRKYRKAEKEEIDSYVASWGDTAYVLTASGLYYIELEAGTGRMPVDKDTVSFKYEARLLNGTLFDTNLEASTTFSFIVGSGSVIPGIDEGVRLMKEGGKAKLLTPSSLAYGTQGILYYLPGYTPLIWYIELIEVGAGSE